MVRQMVGVTPSRALTGRGYHNGVYYRPTYHANPRSIISYDNHRAAVQKLRARKHKTNVSKSRLDMCWTYGVKGDGLLQLDPRLSESGSRSDSEDKETAEDENELDDMEYSINFGAVSDAIVETKEEDMVDLMVLHEMYEDGDKEEMSEDESMDAGFEKMKEEAEDNEADEVDPGEGESYDADNEAPPNPNQVALREIKDSELGLDDEDLAWLKDSVRRRADLAAIYQAYRAEPRETRETPGQFARRIAKYDNGGHEFQLDERDIEWLMDCMARRRHLALVVRGWKEDSPETFAELICRLAVLEQET